MVETLAQYPQIVVRVSCRRCPRRGRYRLARLAARFGAEASLREVLLALSIGCEHWRPATPGKAQRLGCGIYLPDLVEPEPPPAAVPVRLRIVGR